MNSKAELQNANCKMQIAKWGDARTAQLTPCSLLPAPRFGITLTEVLIAMGILTLGLLGVAALFPVGGFYMQRAEIADRGSAVARTVMADIVARGMLNPRSWMVMVPSGNNPPNLRFPSDGKFAPTVTLGTFTRPFAHTLSEALTQPAAVADPTLISQQFGSAFVLDPIGTAAMAMPNNANGGRNVIASPFPSSVFSLPVASSFYNWQSWGNTWPIRRVTFQQASSGWQLSPVMAEHYFRGSDDLATDLPDRDDRPASQNWDIGSVNNQPTPLARSWQGDYSWLVTVVPTTTAARNGMALNPESHSYEVSVVVFHKRVLPSALPASSPEAAQSAAFERAVKAVVLSSGLNGGEVLLEKLDNDINVSESPFEQLRSGNWIMLCGPHPNSNNEAPRFVLNWYQVVSIDGKNSRLNSQGTENPPPAASEPERRLVTLRGSQWPWQPGTMLSNNLCAGICRGIVAVHTKALRLEGPRGTAWSGGSAAGSSFGPNPPSSHRGGPLVVPY